MEMLLKNLVFEVLIAVLERRLGFQAGISSITYILCNALMYEAIESSFMLFDSLLIISSFNNVIGICVP